MALGLEYLRLESRLKCQRIVAVVGW
jgi:hypothetical protein